MKLGRGSLQGLVRFGLAAGVVMAAGTIRSSGAEEPKRELTVVDTPPPGCKELGEVEGKHFRAMSSPSPEIAEKNAREDAAKLGATHAPQGDVPRPQRPVRGGLHRDRISLSDRRAADSGEMTGIPPPAGGVSPDEAVPRVATPSPPS
jgi:hypothetical protein